MLESIRNHGTQVHRVGTSVYRSVMSIKSRLCTKSCVSGTQPIMYPSATPLITSVYKDSNFLAGIVGVVHGTHTP